MAKKKPNKAGKKKAKRGAKVVLTEDLPERGLARGDVGTVVPVHEAGTGYEVEFVTLDGETVAVVTLAASKVRPVARRETAHARAVPG